jgi:outer membrane protein OmpA-like peptidoglycan-associated protein
MKRSVAARIMVALAAALLAGASCPAEERFVDSVGQVKVGQVGGVSPLTVPFITWGGDMATFHANGGLATTPESIFGKLGLNIRLTPGDDFTQQVRDYLAGKTPFLRGTYRMIGMASEAIGADPRTKGVVAFQLTWSAGDHCVAREGVKTIADLKGRKVCLQKGGPHVGMLDDILATARLGWSDITPVWADDLTGTPKSPAEMFRKDPAVAACFVISPDMVGLTGGLRKTGSGAEGTVKNARVLVSTAELSYSIADVYVVRKDFFDAHRDLVTKFVAGYLKACEELIDLRKKYEAGGSDQYTKLLQMTQNIYGKQTIPTLEDAHGLLCDCTFVGHPGNVAFFTAKGNQHGFEVFQTKALDLAVARGYAKVRQGLIPSPLDWSSKDFIGYLTKTEAVAGERYRPEAVAKEITDLSGGSLDERTIMSFTINFKANEDSFSAEQYGVDYQNVVDALGKFGNAVIAVRGHADPTKTLYELVMAGMKKGILQRTGTAGNYRYSLNGKLLDLSSTAEITRLVGEGEFDGVADHNPREVMQAALNLSRKRAEAVRDSIIAFAKAKGIEIDPSQIAPVGVGIREPFIARPRNPEEAEQNMRVEFRLLKVSAEAKKPSDFDF